MILILNCSSKMSNNDTQRSQEKTDLPLHPMDKSGNEPCDLLHQPHHDFQQQRTEVVSKEKTKNYASFLVCMPKKLAHCTLNCSYIHLVIEVSNTFI